MAKLLLDILNLLMEYLPLITSSLITLGLILICAKSIKTHTYIYYIILSIPALLAITNYFGRMTGTVDLYPIPIVGDIMRMYTYMLPLGLPLLLIVMFTGAFNPRSYLAKKLLPIRKELSILSGFPILTHVLYKVSYTFPNSFTKLFLSPEQPLPDSRIYAEIGYQIGIVLTIIYIMLWVTSFTPIRKKIGGVKWRKIHKWSYVLYALVFVHSILLNLGWILGGRTPVAAHDRRPEWITAIISMIIIYSLYIALKIRKSKKIKSDMFSKYF